MRFLAAWNRLSTTRASSCPGKLYWYDCGEADKSISIQQISQPYSKDQKGADMIRQSYHRSARPRLRNRSSVSYDMVPCTCSTQLTCANTTAVPPLVTAIPNGSAPTLIQAEHEPFTTMRLDQPDSLLHLATHEGELLQSLAIPRSPAAVHMSLAARRRYCCHGDLLHAAATQSIPCLLCQRGHETVQLLYT